MLKISGFLGQLKCQSLYNDRIGHIDDKIEKSWCQITN